jgi:hypothetical protein
MARKVVQPKRRIQSNNLEGIIFLIIFCGILIPILSVMGTANFFQTIMLTAHDLLINTVFFLMAVAVLTGALSGMFSEFGVINILDKILKFMMKPLYNLPGIAVMGIITTYFSDNPAIISLTKDRSFLRLFKKWQLPLLCNLGTSFGMGLLISTYMLAQGTKMGESSFMPVLVGNIGAIIGSIISVRIMSVFTKREFGEESYFDESNVDPMEKRIVREGSLFHRVLTSTLEGGRTGVEIGLGIIPGVLIMSTFVMILTYGPADPSIGYQGVAYEGVGFLPWVGEKIFPVIKFLFGFESSKLLAFPLTSLGSSGAALALVPNFIENGILGANEIAVFTSMGMCWSGYLSTHIAMMDSLGYRKLTNKAILSHTIGGLAAGICSHFMMMLFI